MSAYLGPVGVGSQISSGPQRVLNDREKSAHEKLARTRRDSSSETLENLSDHEESGRAVSSLGPDHESDAEEADAETADEEPLTDRKRGDVSTV